MERDASRNYITAAFRRYAAMGRPSYEQAKSDIIADVHRRMYAHNPADVLIACEKELEKATPLLLDIMAVDNALIMLRTGNKEHIIHAVEAVYFPFPSRPLRSSVISARVRRFAQEYPASERAVYYWLREARDLCASVRGLTIE